MGPGTLLVALLACATQPPLPEDAVIIHENAQTTLSGATVGVGNVWEREYTPAGGAPVRGTTAMLFLGDTRIVVGAGSFVELGGSTWRVLAVDKPDGGKGSVTLEPADAR